MDEISHEFPRTLAPKFNIETWNEFIEKVPKSRYLIVCGKGWRRQEIDEQNSVANVGVEGVSPIAWELSPEAKIASVAAGLLYLSGKTDEIIYTGGITSKRSDWISEAEAMKQYTHYIFGDLIPLDKISMEDKAIDTLANAENTKQIVGDEKCSFMTIGYHLDRAEYQFSHQGLTGTWIASEDVLQAYSKDYRLLPLLKKEYGHLLFENIREAVARKLVKSPWGQKIATWAAYVVRTKEPKK